MIAKIDYSKLTNGELTRKLAEFDQEYEAKKQEIGRLVQRLQELDKLYQEVDKEIKRRKTTYVENGKYIN